MRKLLFGVILICCGCHIPSKMVLQGQGGRNDYNIEVQKTNSEEMLLNLVRLRYFDSPFFLQVSSVTSQFTFKNLASAGINLPGFNQTNPMTLGGETQWQNQPTIQYSPLEGQEFANQLMQPLDVNTLAQLIYSGWDIKRVFLLAVQAFNDFHNLSKGGISRDLSRYEKFLDVINLMTKLQREGTLLVGVTETKDTGIEVKNLQFAFPSDDEFGKAIAEHLNQHKPSNGKHIISVVEGFDEKGNIGILPRSLLSCMNFLSHSVLVPEDHLKNNKAIIIGSDAFKQEEICQIFKDLLIVHNAHNKPKDAYISIKYRDTWFYIKDDDLQSKKTFMLLLEIFNLQSGKRQTQGPVLTLPIGVG